MAADELEPSPEVRSHYLNPDPTYTNTDGARYSMDQRTDSRAETTQAFMNHDEMRTSSA